MTDQPKMFALQLQDEILIRKALAVLSEAGIQADFVQVANCSSDDMPEWGQPEVGGWFLRISADRFEDGMKAIEPVMGFSPG